MRSDWISAWKTQFAAEKSHNIDVAAEEKTGGDSEANRLAIHTVREVKAMIRTLQKQTQIAPASVNIGRERADRQNSIESAGCQKHLRGCFQYSDLLNWSLSKTPK